MVRRRGCSTRCASGPRRESRTSTDRRVTVCAQLRIRRLAIAIGLVLPTFAMRAGAQQRDTTFGADVRDTTTRRGVRTWQVAAGLGAAAVAIAPFDVAITRRLRSSDLQSSRAWHDGAVVFDWYGAPGARAVGPLLAVAGSVARSSTLSDIGIHVSESYAASAVAVFIVKGFAGRARPYTVSSESAYDFELGRGFPHREPFSSFPSGHSTGSFAFASSITVEAARHWPEHATLVGALAYGGAFLDGVSRVYRDMHWPSDVAAGALLGTVSGLLVTRHQHAHPDNRLDAFARRVLFAPAADGRLVVGVAQTF
jgi:membrane-associated phospholipid phosphatase